MHSDGTASSAGSNQGNIVVVVDKIFHSRVARVLCDGKPGQRWDGLCTTGNTFGRSRPRAAGERHASAVSLSSKVSL